MNINALMRHAIRGEIKPAFEPLRSVYCSLFEREWDVGSSFVVFWKGKKVAHIDAGYLTPEHKKYYSDNTLQMVGSASKFVESVCIATLVERGLISYDTPISQVWPEFGKYGKKHITLQQLMSHRAGLSSWNTKLYRRDLEDKSHLSKLISDLPLNWAVPVDSPQAAPQAYHTISRGLISSEICHRVDPKKRYMNQFLQEEICKPLGLDITFGEPAEIKDRISPTHYFPPELISLLLGRDDVEIPNHIKRPDPKDPFYQLDELDKQFLINHNLVAESAAHKSVALFHTDKEQMDSLFKEFEIPSSNGVTNAYSLAALASVCANNGAFIPSQSSSISSTSSPTASPVHLLSPHTIKKMTRKYDSYEVDQVIGTIMPFTHGGFASFTAKGQPDCYGWGGAGGVCVRFFPELNLSLAYVTNRMGIKMSFNDPRSSILITAALECAKNAQNKSLAP